MKSTPLLGWWWTAFEQPERAKFWCERRWKRSGFPGWVSGQLGNTEQRAVGFLSCFRESAASSHFSFCESTAVFTAGLFCFLGPLVWPLDAWGEGRFALDRWHDTLSWPSLGGRRCHVPVPHGRCSASRGNRPRVGSAAFHLGE